METFMHSEHGGTLAQYADLAAVTLAVTPPAAPLDIDAESSDE